MNEFNRLLIVFVASLIIILMAVVIFLVWAAPDDVIRNLGDAVEFLDDNDGLAGQLIVTLGALTIGVLALLMIIVELAPEDEPKELRVEQAGATTVIPADALRLRLEEALLSLPEVTAARSRVTTRDGGISTALDLTVTPQANLAEVTQSANRVVIDTVQSDLGLPVAGVPSVKFAFGGSKAGATRPAPPAESVVPLAPSPSVLAPIDPPPASAPEAPASEPTAFAHPPSESTVTELPSMDPPAPATQDSGPPAPEPDTAPPPWGAEPEKPRDDTPVP
jgi:hypothetical protein